MMRATDFREYLNVALAGAERLGMDSLDVRSGDLHEKVGGYPGAGHRMPVCCGVMRAAMAEQDVILEQPPKGNGANLIVRYMIPRT